MKPLYWVPALIVSVVALGLYWRSDDFAFQQRAPMQLPEKCWWAAQVAVKDRLKNPDDANFCARGDVGAGTELLDASTGRAWGWVIAEDDSGQKGKITWDAILEKAEGGMRPVMVRVGDRKYGLAGTP
jgi:hypothetical protein